MFVLFCEQLLGDGSGHKFMEEVEREEEGGGLKVTFANDNGSYKL